MVTTFILTGCCCCLCCCLCCNCCCGKCSSDDDDDDYVIEIPPDFDVDEATASNAAFDSVSICIRLTHADGSRVSEANIRVCLSVCLIVRTITQRMIPKCPNLVYGMTLGQPVDDNMILG